MNQEFSKGAWNNERHEPGYLERLARDVDRSQNEESKEQEQEYREFPELRSPQERQRDAEIIAELRKSVFPEISIDPDALASAIARWQKTKDLKTLQSFFRRTRNDDEDIVKEFGPNGLEAMGIVIEKIKELEEKFKKQ